MKEKLLEEYSKWVNQRIKIEEFDDFIEITTPFVDVHHDYIQLYLTKTNGAFCLSDDGRIINELEMLGVDIKKSKKRLHFFNTTLKIFGVRFMDTTDEMYINFSNIKEYPQAQHQLLQCILRVSDMLLTSKNQVANIFEEDIENYFDVQGVPYILGASYAGKSGVNHTFDFSIPKFRNKNAKLIKAVNNPNPNQAQQTLFAWLDLKDVRENYDLHVIANDSSKNVSSKFVEMFNNYDIDVHTWSTKDKWISELKII